MKRKLFVLLQTFCYRVSNPLFTYGVLGIPHMLLLIFRQYRLYTRLNHWWAGGILPWLWQKSTIKGLEYIEKADSGKRFVIVANHACYLDIPAVISLFKDVPVTWVVKESLMMKPIVGQMIQLGMGTPIPRLNARASQNEILRRTAGLRKAMNPHIAVFPEGTRTRNGEIGDFKRGFTLLMRRYEMDILPISICGFYTFAPRHCFWTNPDARIEIIVHPPVPYHTLKDLDDKTIARKMRDIVVSAYHP